VIFELDKNDYKKILPLYLKEKIAFPLILAVIQRKQRGWVFVDDPGRPTSALVVTNFGFTQLIGADDFGIEVIRFFQFPESYLPSYLLWYSPPLRIQELLDKFTPERVRRRERARFIFKKQSIENPIEYPVGFGVRLLDRELIRKTELFKLDIGSRFWKSPDDFLEHGFGACVMKDEEIVGMCYSACIVDELAEVDVVTKHKYRGMGLATVAAQCFISECVRRGITPTWDCFVNNIASMKLANRLEFVQTVSYPFYSFNIPADFASRY